MTPHPYDVSILFLDYDVIIFVGVNPSGIVTSSTPLRPSAEPPFISTWKYIHHRKRRSGSDTERKKILS